MVRKALRERLPETPKKSGGSAGNSRLRSELRWQEDTCAAVHATLVEDGVVMAGRGRGGSVALVNGEKHPPAMSAQPASAARRDDKQAGGAAPLMADNGGSRFEQTFKNINDIP